MTQDQLKRGNDLNEKINETRQLLNHLQGAKMVGVSFHWFEEERTVYHKEEVFDLPKNEIKKALIAHYQTKLAHLESTFAKLGQVYDELVCVKYEGSMELYETAN